MSTTHLMMEPDEVRDFIEETKKLDGLYTFGYEDGAEYGVCPYITFYVLHGKEETYLDEDGDQFEPSARERMINRVIDLHEALEKLIDRPYRKMLKNSTEVWLKVGDKRLPTDLREEGRKAIAKGQPFWLQATDQDNPSSSARWAFDGRVTNNPSMRYSTVKITFRCEWYLQHKAQWRAFVKHCLEVLRPEQCYSGFEVGNTCSGYGGAYEAGVMERICADHFYGVDLDHPSDMGFHDRFDEDGYVNVSRLGAGLRTPTWCFLLSPYWLQKLGLSEELIYQAFAGQSVRITPVQSANAQLSYWIELGELDLHPVENGIPPVLAAANRLIRPVRCNDLILTSLDPWDEDPNPRFDSINGPRWMARFDEDCDWPEGQTQPQAPASDAATPAAHTVLSALPGQAVPQAGTWSTTALLDVRAVTLRLGDTLPLTERDRAGNAVIWYLKLAA